MREMRPKELREVARAELSIQTYGQSQDIVGVRLKDLTSFVDDGGYFLEVDRFDQGVGQAFPDFSIRQINYAQVLPGAIKAFHLHFKQDDIWFVPPHDRLLVILSDQRKDSPSTGVLRRLILGGGASQLLFIPRGVAHGVANPWQIPASMLYLVNEQFNPQAPDEGRLPWDFLGREIWEISRG